MYSVADYHYRDRPAEAQRLRQWFKTKQTKYEAAGGDIDAKITIFAELIQELVQLWAREHEQVQ
jgi:hypothetical protein